MTDLSPLSEHVFSGDLVLSQPLALDQHPALVYLASLSVVSRRTMAQALAMIAHLLSGGALYMLTSRPLRAMIAVLKKSSARPRA